MPRFVFYRILGIFCLWCGISFHYCQAADVPALIQKLQAVGPNGLGHREAALAWRELSQVEVAEIPAILNGLDHANPLAANWLRSAVDTIAERQLKLKKPLPTADLEKFLLQVEHNPLARRLAFEWLVQADATSRERLLSKMLDDPSIELRRDAVAQCIAAAARLEEQADPAATLIAYQKAFSAARDKEQIKDLAEKLQKLGSPVDLPVHYGFVMEWKLIGPFDNTDKKGFAVAYPPETEVNLQKKLDGKEGPVEWIDYTTTDPRGVVDLNVALKKHMGAVAYAFVEISVPNEIEAEIRLGCINANKAWCNNQLLFENEAYHTAFEIDQFSGKTRLHPGKNQILIKVCQNEQTEVWAQDWKFQLRVCDKIGTAILSTDRPPTPKKTAVEANSKTDQSAPK